MAGLLPLRFRQATSPLPKLRDGRVVRRRDRGSVATQIALQRAQARRQLVNAGFKGWVGRGGRCDVVGDLFEAIERISDQGTVIVCAKGVHHEVGKIAASSEGTHFQIVAQHDR